MVTESELREQIQRLNQIGIALSSETDLEKLLELILREVRGFTSADAGSLYIVEEDTLIFQVAQNDSLAGEQEPFKPFPIPLTKKSIAGYVAITNEVLNIQDVYVIPEAAEYQWGGHEFDRKHGYRTQSMLTVPMVDHEGKVIGVLQVINCMSPDQKTTIAFSVDYEDLVRSLASQAAVSIRNARLLNEIRELFDAVVRYSAAAIDERSPYTAGHSQRVAELAVALAHVVNECHESPLAELSFTPEEIEELRIAGLLHDIGKIGIPEVVLDKANKLSGLYDGIEFVKGRFEAIKRDVIIEGLQRKTELLLSRLGLQSSDEEVAAVDRETERRLAELRDEVEFLARANTPGEFMEDKKLEHLREIADKVYRDESGDEKHYVTDPEVHNLSVRKGSLTEEERQEINSHPLRTRNILEKIPFTGHLMNVPAYAAAHHEKLNGKGYPLGLTEMDLGAQARILAIVDFFEALTASDRPYKKAMSPERAYEIMKFDVESHGLDADLFELFFTEKVYEGIRRT